MNNYLSLILFTPLIGALVMLFVSKQNENAIRWIANITAFIGSSRCAWLVPRVSPVRAPGLPSIADGLSASA
jgi:NADH:ubiquinone oxidoreductase subunit 4 (subunit M)